VLIPAKKRGRHGVEHFVCNHTAAETLGQGIEPDDIGLKGGEARLLALAQIG
jgi:hypothetical protein